VKESIKTIMDTNMTRHYSDSVPTHTESIWDITKQWLRDATTSFISTCIENDQNLCLKNMTIYIGKIAMIRVRIWTSEGGAIPRLRVAVT
jgi:hypothetical protein